MYISLSPFLTDERLEAQGWAKEPQREKGERSRGAVQCPSFFLPTCPAFSLIITSVNGAAPLQGRRVRL
jgi:hypothetical protein